MEQLIAILGFAGVTAFLYAWIVAVVNRDRVRSEALNTIVNTERAMVQGLLGANDMRPAPEHQIVAWTPAEREAFGINDTMRFIEETDKLLKAQEWASLPGISGGAAHEVGQSLKLHEILGLPGPGPRQYAAGGIITAERIHTGHTEREPVIEVHAWGEEKPIRVLEPEFEHQLDRSSRTWHVTTFHKRSGLAVSHPVSHELALDERELSQAFKAQREQILEQLSPTVTGGRVFG